MKVTNDSNYPRIVRGTRIEPGETVELSVDAVMTQKLKGSGKFTVEEDDNPSAEDGSEDDTEETSKSQEKDNNKGDD